MTYNVFNGRLNPTQSINPGCSAVTDIRQVAHTHAPLFTKQHKLLPAKGRDALKLGR